MKKQLFNILLAMICLQDIVLINAGEIPQNELELAPQGSRGGGSGGRGAGGGPRGGGSFGRAGGGMGRSMGTGRIGGGPARMSTGMGRGVGAGSRGISSRPAASQIRATRTDVDRAKTIAPSTRPTVSSRPIAVTGRPTTTRDTSPTTKPTVRETQQRDVSPTTRPTIRDTGSGRPGIAGRDRGTRRDRDQRVSSLREKTGQASRDRRIDAARKELRGDRFRDRAHRDWNRFGRWHRFGRFNRGLWADFLLLSPWYLFPYWYWGNYYNYYSPCWNRWNWFNYPCYWDYGYPREIRIVEYVNRGDYVSLIERLEERLNQLEAEIRSSQETDELRGKINEILWILKDIQNILNESQISGENKNRLQARIDNIINRVQAAGYIQELGNPSNPDDDDLDDNDELEY